MACPIAPVLVLGAVAGGGHTLYVQDRQHRLTAWLASFALLAGWAIYGAIFRHTGLRITLEVLSVFALVAGGARVAWLMRTGRVRSPLWDSIGRGTRGLWVVFGDRPVLAVKIWLLAMITMQWRGLVRFSGWEYATIASALVLLVAYRLYRIERTARTRRGGFAALESFAEGAAPAACPLGFGCAAQAPIAGRGRTTEAGDRP